MAIKEIITLEGVTEVEAQLKRLGTAGERSLSQFSKIGTAAGGTDPFARLVDGAKKAGLEFNTFNGHTTKISDVLKILKPALNEAGASIGGLGQFARVAGIGMTGLAAAVGGAVVVKLADLEEASANTKAKLSDLFGSTANGERAFKALETSAKSLHTTTNDLLPSIEALQRGLDKFNAARGFKFVGEQPLGLAVKPEETIEAVANLTRVLRASGLSADEANAAAKEFFATLRAGGTVSAEMLNKLPTGAVEELAKAFKQGAISAETFIAAITKGDVSVPIDKATKGLVSFTEAQNAALDAKIVRSYKDAWADLVKFIEESFTAGTGTGFSDFLRNQLDKFRTDTQSLIELLKGAGSVKPEDFIGGDLFRQAGDKAGQDFSAGLQAQLSTVQTFFQSLYDRIVQIFANPVTVNLQAQSGFFGTPFGFAGGGMVRGPGSTTSDSILAFLSDREYVVNARATAAYLPLLQAINAMSLPKDFIGRFAMGGLARSVSGNRFAGGGQVRSGNPVILKIDRQTFNMTAGDDTVAALKRFSVAAQLASTGRKPSWVK